MSSEKIKIAIIGTGNIGTDLCARILKNSAFEVVALVGRRANSPGLMLFKDDIKYTISNGITGLLEVSSEFEGFFDATSAFDHEKHWEILKPLNKWAIDLTPSQVGVPMVPELIGVSKKFTILNSLIANYSMVTCGGQSSAPIIYAITKHSKQILEIEVSSSISSKSAGPATRLNIDQYIESTENLIRVISNCKNVKAILVLNPSEPPVMMRTTVHVKANSFDLVSILKELELIESKIKIYVPGYDVVVVPHISSLNTISATVKITGAGFYLPAYAGNLDIINAAAVETAQRHAQSFGGRIK
jgi:acetaldehyde dehydrogenase (acetylating)